jgi:hypothetical protein
MRNLNSFPNPVNWPAVDLERTSLTGLQEELPGRSSNLKVEGEVQLTRESKITTVLERDDSGEAEGPINLRPHEFVGLSACLFFLREHNPYLTGPNSTSPETLDTAPVVQSPAEDNETAGPDEDDSLDVTDLVEKDMLNRPASVRPIDFEKTTEHSESKVPE